MASTVNGFLQSTLRCFGRGATARGLACGEDVAVIGAAAAGTSGRAFAGATATVVTAPTGAADGAGLGSFGAAGGAVPRETHQTKGNASKATASAAGNQRWFEGAAGGGRGAAPGACGKIAVAASPFESLAATADGNERPESVAISSAVAGAASAREVSEWLLGLS
ncbi:MAG TPA: hypothetical protein VM686_10220, partial [Polyangiaceae bacterium]|nr:hypothetical protein [Polyangiaceae bacterium]